MITGLKLRNTELADWQPKSMKEPEMSRRDIIYPLPFAFSRDMILDKNACIFLVEGHVDGLSLPVTYSKTGQSEINYEKCNTYFVASPGTNGISEEFLGLLRGKFVVLAFDQDEAGRKGAYGEIKISYGDEKASFVNDFEGKKAAELLLKDFSQMAPGYNYRQLDVSIKNLHNHTLHQNFQLGYIFHPLFCNNSFYLLSFHHLHT